MVVEVVNRAVDQALQGRTLKDLVKDDIRPQVLQVGQTSKRLPG
jgi:hypothetical protein